MVISVWSMSHSTSFATVPPLSLDSHIPNLRAP